MTTKIIIDGYNFLWQDGLFREQAIRGHDKGREAVLQWLSGKPQLQNFDVTVVFDAYKTNSQQASEEKIRGLRVIYTAGGQSADDWIRNLAASEGPAAIIVSSDHEVMRYAEKKGCGVLGSRDFQIAIEKPEAFEPDPAQKLPKGKRKALNKILSKVALGLLILFLMNCQREFKPFLPIHALKIAESSDEVRAANLKSMVATPRMMEPIELTHLLTKVQSTRLLHYLKEATDFDPEKRFLQCQFQPGAQFEFYSTDLLSWTGLRNDFRKPDLIILLCFNCDVWALGEKTNGLLGTDQRKVIAFGDIGSSKEGLLSLTKEVFGDDWMNRQY